jgi:hypothetical protein
MLVLLVSLAFAAALMLALAGGLAAAGGLFRQRGAMAASSTRRGIMANKSLFAGILVMALVFGMTVLGCYPYVPDDEEVDNRPFLEGSVSIDKYYPVIGETITATWSDPFNNPDDTPIGTPAWRWYKTQKDISFVNDVLEETVVGFSNTYTVQATDAGFWLYAVLTYSGNRGFQCDYTYSTVIGIPATATVSVSINAARILGNDAYSTMPNHRVTITLSLSDGKWKEVSYNTVSNWISLSGTPLVSLWSSPPSVSNTTGRDLVISYKTRSESTLSISGLTVTLVSAQLSAMRSYTNVYNTLTAGTPSTASVSAWTMSQF